MHHSSGLDYEQSMVWYSLRESLELQLPSIAWCSLCAKWSPGTQVSPTAQRPIVGTPDADGSGLTPIRAY